MTGSGAGLAEAAPRLADVLRRRMQPACGGAAPAPPCRTARSADLALPAPARPYPACSWAPTSAARPSVRRWPACCARWLLRRTSRVEPRQPAAAAAAAPFAAAAPRARYPRHALIVTQHTVARRGNAFQAERRGFGQLCRLQRLSVLLPLCSVRMLLCIFAKRVGLEMCVGGTQQPGCLYQGRLKKIAAEMLEHCCGSSERRAAGRAAALAVVGGEACRPDRCWVVVAVSRVRLLGQLNRFWCSASGPSSSSSLWPLALP